ncbi:MAG TPA: hypothetical protein VN213_06640 [Solirubrobacteraceae bacterium]|nr:hypothetical protein [Solirubrobacteraceae bacterium]
MPERVALIAVAHRTAVLRKELEDRQAVLIVNRLAEAMGGKRG